MQEPLELERAFLLHTSDRAGPTWVRIPIMGYIPYKNFIFKKCITCVKVLLSYSQGVFLWRCVMARHGRAVRSTGLSSCVSDQQSLGSSLIEPWHLFSLSKIFYHSIIALPFSWCTRRGSACKKKALIMEEQGLALVFLVHIASIIVYRFSHACLRGD